jgi:hypothetical protein
MIRHPAAFLQCNGRKKTKSRRLVYAKTGAENKLKYNYLGGGEE